MKIRYQFTGSGAISISPGEIAGHLDRGATDAEIVDFILECISEKEGSGISISPHDKEAPCAAVREIWENDGGES